MTSLRRILRRNSSAELQAALPATLHPVLRRVYGARPIAGADELALRLDQLLPVSTLDGAESAADLLASAASHAAGECWSSAISTRTVRRAPR